MPGRDRSGPTGLGPMTGRGSGDCASGGSSVQDFVRRRGRGYGGGWGRRRGYRGGSFDVGERPGWRFPDDTESARQPTAADERQQLEDEVARLRKELVDLATRLRDLESSESETKPEA